MINSKDLSQLSEQLARDAVEGADRVWMQRSRWLRMRMIAVGILTSVFICVPIVVISLNVQEHAQTQDLKYVCGEVGGIQHVIGQFLSSDAGLRKTQAYLGVTKQVINTTIKDKNIKAKIQTLLQESTDASNSTADYWQNYLLPQLSAIGQTACKKALQ